tara:strand:+ start:95 stop:277 length:183 start_codon:yes stop_codon:yes gene_type:complete
MAPANKIQPRFMIIAGVIKNMIVIVTGNTEVKKAIKKMTLIITINAPVVAALFFLNVSDI